MILTTQRGHRHTVTVARVLKGLSEAESDPAASNASVRRERASEPVQPSERASEGRTTTGAVGRTDGREEGGGRRRRGGGCAHMLKKWPCARSRSVAHRRSSPLIPNSLPSPIFFSKIDPVDPVSLKLELAISYRSSLGLQYEVLGLVADSVRKVLRTL